MTLAVISHASVDGMILTIGCRQIDGHSLGVSAKPYCATDPQINDFETSR